jgi:hypothetical protein
LASGCGACLLVALAAVGGLGLLVAACAGLAVLGSNVEPPAPRPAEPVANVPAQVPHVEPVVEHTPLVPELDGSDGPAAVVPDPEPARQATDLRTWHDASGKFQTEAQFVNLTAGVVTLRKTDGTTVKVPVEKLSEGDREWIEARRRETRR